MVTKFSVGPTHENSCTSVDLKLVTAEGRASLETFQKLAFCDKEKIFCPPIDDILSANLLSNHVSREKSNLPF